MIKVLKKGSIYGKLAVLTGLFVLLPLIAIPFYKEDMKFIWAFIIPGLFSIVIGIIICLCTTSNKKSMVTKKTEIQTGYFVVLATWIWGIFIGALPFIISGQLKVIQSLFEAVSGWTTTGLSVMNVEKMPKIFMLYRSMTQYFGGLGFMLMMAMIVYNKQSMNLYEAEGHIDRLMPNIKKSAQLIFAMFVFFLVVGTLAYRLGGMRIFEGICHSMCALSTGGFSTRLNSIGEYNSIYIETVTIVLMIIGTLNFGVLLLLIKGKLKRVIKVSEVSFMLKMMVIFTVITGIATVLRQNISIMGSARISLFNIVSALSTSGYSTVDYNNLPDFVVGITVLMMIIGGGMGSTAGGIKLTRAYIFMRIALNNLYTRINSDNYIKNLCYKNAQGKTYIDNKIINDTVGFIAFYLVIYVCGSLALTMSAGCSLTKGMFEFASAIGTVGLSIGVTGEHTNNISLIIEIVGMLLGRLEIFIVIVGIYESGKKMKTSIKNTIEKLTKNCFRYGNNV